MPAGGATPLQTRYVIAQVRGRGHGLGNELVPWARALLAAVSLQESGELADLRSHRYAGWDGPLGSGILGDTTLADLHELALRGALDPQPVSGRQELLENLVNRHVERAR